MSGFGVRRLAVALAVVMLAGPVAAQSSSEPASASEEPQALVPEDIQGFVGDWLLEQEDQSAATCAITFTDQEAIGGWAVEVPQPCPAPFPTEGVMAWNVDDSGNIILLDAVRHVVLRLMEDEDGLYDTDPSVEPRFYLVYPYDEDGAGGEADTDG